MESCPSINMVQYGIDPINTTCMQRFSHLDILTKYQYLSYSTVLIPKVRFFDAIAPFMGVMQCYNYLIRM